MQAALEPLDINPTTQTYRLDKKYVRFRADVAIKSQPNESDVPITFSVFGDNKRLWDSLPLTPRGGAQTCSISVKNVDVLKCEVHYQAPVWGKHVVWIDAAVE